MRDQRLGQGSGDPRSILGEGCCCHKELTLEVDEKSALQFIELPRADAPDGSEIFVIQRAEVHDLAACSYADEEQLNDVEGCEQQRGESLHHAVKIDRGD